CMNAGMRSDGCGPCTGWLKSKRLATRSPMTSCTSSGDVRAQCIWPSTCRMYPPPGRRSSDSLMSLGLSTTTAVAAVSDISLSVLPLGQPLDPKYLDGDAATIPLRNLDFHLAAASWDAVLVSGFPDSVTMQEYVVAGLVGHDEPEAAIRTE